MTSRILVVNGVPRAAPDPVPLISSFLESTRGAYTTTRTTASASLLLFWDRHLRRLAQSAAILSAAAAIPPIPSPSAITPLVETSLRTGLRIALGRRGAGEELAVTALVSGGEKVDVYVHIGMYVPLALGVGACLAVAGPGRELAQAKYSEWARIRKRMEGLRSPEVTELLLSNDGDRILEGSVTNFFVVRRQDLDLNGFSQSLKVMEEFISLKTVLYIAHYYDTSTLYFIGQSPKTPNGPSSLEVQTAPVSDGVLPGVVRHLVFEICYEMGIPIQEVAPSWSERESWEEAFVTSSLRHIQHAKTIQAPLSWGDLQLGSWRRISWMEKRFEGPGAFTTMIQNRLLERARTDGYPVSYLI